MAKTVTLTCKGCNCNFEVQYKLRKQKYCTRECVNKSYAGEGNPAYGKAYRTKESHPEWAKKISETSVEREINKGDKNGMKNPDVAKRQGQTRSYKFASDPSWKEKASKTTRDAWASGKYNHSPVGRCKWFDHVKPNGEIVKLQGTWEVVFAHHMDSLCIEYKSHEGRLKYYDAAGNEKSYYPDFYVPMWDVYIDVKGAFFEDIQKEKFDHVFASNPNVKIFLVTKEVFKSFGIDITKATKEALQ